MKAGSFKTAFFYQMAFINRKTAHVLDIIIVLKYN